LNYLPIAAEGGFVVLEPGGACGGAANMTV